MRSRTTPRWFPIGCSCLLLLITTRAAASDLRRGELSNGLEYVLVEDHNRTDVAVSGCFRIGGRTEAMEQKGLTHFLEHLIGRGGTAHLSRQEWQSIRSRIDYAAYTGHDGSCFDFQVPPDELPDSLRYYAQALFELEITDEDVELEREVVLQERSRGLSMPFGPLEHHLWPAAFTEHPYRSLTIGREDVVRSADADTFRTFLAERYRPNQLFLAVVGNFDPSAVEDLLGGVLGAYAPGAPSFELGLTEPAQKGYREVLIDGEAGHSRLLLGCKVPGAGHPDAAALDVAAGLLGHGPTSRLAASLLDSQTALSISASSSGSRDPGLFVFALESVPGQEAQSLAMLWETLRGIASGEAGAQEVEREKRALEVNRAIDRESAMDRARSLTAAELSGSYTLELSQSARLRAVTEADVARVVARYLSPDRCTLVASVTDETAGGWRHLAESALVGWPRIDDASRAGTSIHRPTLPNGLTALVEVRPGVPTQAMEVRIVGASWETPEDLAGLADVGAQALVLQPVEDDTSLEEVVATVGGRLQAQSAADHIDVAVETLVEDFPRVAEALFRGLADHRVSAESLATARRRAEAAMSIADTQGEWLARSRLFAELFPRHAYGMNPDPDTLRRIDAQALTDLFERTLRGDRVVVTLVGGLDFTSAEALLSGSLGALPSGGPSRGPGLTPPAGPTAERISIPRDVPQAQIATGLATVGTRHDDFPPLRVSARLLWARLFYRFVRGEEPIAYWLRADLGARVGPSPFFVQAGISPGDESRLLQGIREELEALGSGFISPAELERAHGRLLDEFSPREGNREQARLRADYELLFGQGAALDELAERLRRVSTEDVRRVVTDYLLPVEWPVVVVGPETKGMTRTEEAPEP